MHESFIYYDFKEGTAATNNLPDRFEDLPKHDIEVFQAECIQNIYDARSKKAKDEGLPVEVDFTIDRMKNNEISDFKEIMGREFFNRIRISYDKSDSFDVKDLMQKVINNLDDEKNWIALRIIEKNTTGLNGYEDPDREEGQRSKFDALMRAVNKTEKDEAIAGGTFGKGSSVYTYSSGLWMWFAYSVLDEPFNINMDQDNEIITYARFMGRGIIAPYVDRNEMNTLLGHKWFAREKNALPFINEEAHEYARKFKLPERGKYDFGTSYFIPAFYPDEEDEISVENVIKKFRNTIVQKWFIPIYDGELICRLKSFDSDIDDILINKDYILHEVSELRYKLEIIEWYKNDCRPLNPKFKKIEIPVDLPVIKDQWKEDFPYAKSQKTGYCHLIIREIEDNESGFKGFNTYNRIALTRNVGMIINHYPYVSDDSDPEDNPFNLFIGEKKFEAILFAGKMATNKESTENHLHLDLFLSFAENPAHNMWIFSDRDLGRCRLRRFEKNPAPYPWNRINKLYKKIEQEIRKAFPKEDSIPVKKDICNFWKKLAHLSKAGDTSGKERNFHYKILSEGLVHGRYQWDIQLKSNIDDYPIEIVMNNYLNSLEPGKERDFETLGIQEFEELEIITETSGDKIILYPRETKEITIKTCNVINNSVFMNLQPILEIQDKIIDDDTKV